MSEQDALLFCTVDYPKGGAHLGSANGWGDQRGLEGAFDAAASQAASLPSQERRQPTPARVEQGPEICQDEERCGRPTYRRYSTPSHDDEKNRNARAGDSLDDDACVVVGCDRDVVDHERVDCQQHCAGMGKEAGPRVAVTCLKLGFGHDMSTLQQSIQTCLTGCGGGVAV